MATRDGFLPSDRPYIIAEIGGNHGGNIHRAKEYVTAASEAGADAAKFQLYSAKTLILEDEPPLPLAGDDYDTQFERFEELELTKDEWREVIEYCESLDIDFTASVFDREWLEFVSDHTPFIKIASGDMTNLPLLRHAAQTGKPIVMSTGFSTIGEIRNVVQEISDVSLVLLHCMGCYPTADDAANLLMVEYLADEFDVTVGYSDHTVGTLAPIASVAKGARVVEKHFTLDKSKEVGDHRLSATPEEMSEIVSETKRIAVMEGSRRGGETYDCEGQIREDMRRSLATRRPVEAGETLAEDDVTALRPASGISPMRYDDVIGSEVRKDLDAKQLLRESDLREQLD